LPRHREAGGIWRRAHGDLQREAPHRLRRRLAARHELIEASKAIDPTLSSTPPDAMLSIIVLNEQRTFQLADFLAGETPPRDQIAVAQTLVHQA